MAPGIHAEGRGWVHEPGPSVRREDFRFLRTPDDETIPPNSQKTKNGGRLHASLA